MFMGRVREIGIVDDFDGTRVRIRAPGSGPAVQAGGSVCVNGVKLTVEGLDGAVFTATVSAQTRERSSFAALSAGTPVNIELPLTQGAALDGHLVQGCVDGTGRVTRTADENGCLKVWIRPAERLLRHLVDKAPIAVDGVSVTVAERLRDRFSIVVLPVTRAATTLGQLTPGTRVNLELDVVNRLITRRGRAGRGDLPGVTSALGRAGHAGGRHGVDLVLAHLAAGGGVAVWDPVAEQEGDVIFAGARLRPDAFRFLLTEACGHPAVPCAPGILDQLEIGPMPGPGDRQGTAFHIPVDLARGEGTGVSAAERAAVVRRLADPAAVPADFLRPGHVYPLRARPGLLAERGGYTEATVALCTAAGLPPAGVCCEVMNRDGTMAGAADFEVAALRWGLPLVEVPDLKAWL